MKTKDFIKMLQEADPEGESYVRLPCGGAPWFAERIPGYWDGSYQYLEKINPNDTEHYGNLKIVTSRAGSKVDIHTYDYDSIIWDEHGDMDKIKKRVKLEEIHEYSEKSIWRFIEEEAEFARDYDKKFLEKWYEDVVEEFYENDWEIRQPLDKKIGMYHCMKAHKLFHIPKSLNQGQCDILIRSGNFYPEKKKKYYVWHHDPEKGMNWSIN